ncbi:44990_t:CDS:2 [Gigaspora margarita]|uniref:44990_t:CDS:1 n=1 Tax=Gigaspora margarita TaxID=4874 RepID=A0ABN7UKP9_GIGMA|nr:44990_t:CDS:2 [Gigaspora margarita]
MTLQDQLRLFNSDAILSENNNLIDTSEKKIEIEKKSQQDNKCHDKTNESYKSSPNQMEFNLSRYFEFGGAENSTTNNNDAPSKRSDSGIGFNMNINPSRFKVDVSFHSPTSSDKHNTVTLHGNLLPSDTKEKLDTLANAFSKLFF